MTLPTKTSAGGMTVSSCPPPLHAAAAERKREEEGQGLSLYLPGKSFFFFLYGNLAQKLLLAAVLTFPLRPTETRAITMQFQMAKHSTGTKQTKNGQKLPLGQKLQPKHVASDGGSWQLRYSRGRRNRAAALEQPGLPDNYDFGVKKYRFLD